MGNPKAGQTPDTRTHTHPIHTHAETRARRGKGLKEFAVSPEVTLGEKPAVGGFHRFVPRGSSSDAHTPRAFRAFPKGPRNPVRGAGAPPDPARRSGRARCSPSNGLGARRGPSASRPAPRARRPQAQPRPSPGPSRPRPMEAPPHPRAPPRPAARGGSRDRGAGTGAGRGRGGSARVGHRCPLSGPAPPRPGTGLVQPRRTRGSLSCDFCP